MDGNKIVVCPMCGGMGIINSFYCTLCNGDGLVIAEEAEDYLELKKDSDRHLDI
jgi:DnaJ-class molecular chaperone